MMREEVCVGRGTGILSKAQSGQPGASSPGLSLRRSRRAVTSSWNFSSVSVTPWAMRMFMLSIERWPSPDQFRGSTTLRFAGVFS